MRLIVRCDSHSVAPEFFGKAMKMDFDKSEGISPMSYMAFRKSVNILIQALDHFLIQALDHFNLNFVWSSSIAANDLIECTKNFHI